MSIEAKGPGGVGNSYGQRSTTNPLKINSTKPKKVYNEFDAGEIQSLVSGVGNAVVVCEGDSRTANGVSVTQGFTCYGYPSWLRALSVNRPRVYNFGVSGNTTAQILARKEAVAAVKPWAVVLWCGVNDVATLGNSQAVALQAVANIQALVSYYLGTAGARNVVLLMETGYNGWDATSVAAMLTINKGLIAIAAADSRVRLVDTLKMVVDYTAATQVPITYLSGVFADTVHPSVALSHAIGKEVASIIDGLLGAPSATPFLMPGDTENLLVNKNLTGAGGANYGSGFSGAIPSSWFGFQSGNATVVASLQANASQPNLREMKLVITTSGAADVTVFQDPIAGLVAGDNIVASGEVEVVGTPVALLSAQFNLYTVIGGVTKYNWPLFYTPGYDPVPPASSWPQAPLVLREPETGVLTIGAGVQTNLRASYTMRFSGAGSATVHLRKPKVRKVSADYVS